MNGLTPHSVPGFGMFTHDDVLARRLPPGMKHFDAGTGGSVLYIIEFTDGLIKVGRSAHPQERVSSHLRDATKFGCGAIRQGWLSPWHDNHVRNETALIECGSAQAREVRGNEYLYGASFRDLLRFAQSRLTYRPAIYGPISPWAGSSFFGSVQVGLNEAEAAVLPPVSDPLDPSDPDVYAGMERLSELKGISFRDVAEMSWVDYMEMNLETKVQNYEAKLRLNLALRLRAIYDQERLDLLAPLVSMDHWMWDTPDRQAGS